MGVVTGDMLVSGKPRDASFQRKTGYVQQQDLHLETSTVREALRFWAYLRQPKSVPVHEKQDFVEDVINMLNMQDFAEAIVGVPGEGLNVEQRRLLTIVVELAAKPALLLFLDEPTSGLDLQSSWAIVAFLRKLAKGRPCSQLSINPPRSCSRSSAASCSSPRAGAPCTSAISGTTRRRCSTTSTATAR